MAFLSDTKNNKKNSKLSSTNKNTPHWYTPLDGIHRSTHPSVSLPQTDVVSHLFAAIDDLHKKPSSSLSLSSSPALIDASSATIVTYSDLRRRVEALSAYLRNHHGLSIDDVVLCLLPNSVDYPIVILAVLRSGGTVSTMNPLSSDAEILRQAKDCRPKLAFAGADRAEEIRRLGLDCVAVDSISDSELEFEENPVVISPDDAAAIMYSSGTTGESKGVVLTHRNLVAMIELFVRFEASQYDDEFSGGNSVYLAALPMFHIYGMALFAIGVLSLGAAVVVLRRFDAGEVAAAVERFGVTHIPVVPPILTAISRLSAAEKARMKSLRQVSSGAAPLTGKAIQDFVEAFPNVDFIQGYGMTESTAVGTRGFNTEKFRNFCSVGLLAPNMEAKVVDTSTGTFLPLGGVGELWLRGPAIMKGYLNNESATRSTVDKDGWLHTGDLVYFDQYGYLYIVDRLKEIIKYKGFQIAPADLEAVLASNPDILDVAVSAVADEDSGEIPVAFVVRKKGSSLSAEAVMEYVAKQVAPYKKIRKVVFTPSIPKSASGKILRRELRRSLCSNL